MKGNCLSEAQVYGCFVMNKAATILIDQEQIPEEGEEDHPEMRCDVEQ